MPQSRSGNLVCFGIPFHLDLFSSSSSSSSKNRAETQCWLIKIQIVIIIIGNYLNVETDYENIHANDFDSNSFPKILMYIRSIDQKRNCGGQFETYLDLCLSHEVVVVIMVQVCSHYQVIVRHHSLLRHMTKTNSAAAKVKKMSRKIP